MLTHTCNFKVTGSIDIYGKTLVEKARMPSLLFLEGNLKRSLINRLILGLNISGQDSIKIPLTEDYAYKTGYDKYVLEYNKLKKCQFSDYILQINVKELIDSLIHSKEDNSQSEIYKDSTSFLEDIFESELKKIKETYELS